MTETTYEKLLRRYRYMMIDSGAMPKNVSNEQLLNSLKAETHEDQMKAMKILIGLVPEEFWLSQGL